MMAVKPGLEIHKVPPTTGESPPKPPQGISSLRELSMSDFRKIYESMDSPFMNYVIRETEKEITGIALNNLVNRDLNHDEMRGRYLGLMAITAKMQQVKNEWKRRLDRDSASETPDHGRR